MTKRSTSTDYAPAVHNSEWLYCIYMEFQPVREAVNKTFDGESTTAFTLTELCNGL